MTYGDIRRLLNETGMSPEQMGGRIGISGMTLRRWADLPEDHRVHPLYEKALHEVIYELLAEGRISDNSEHVKLVLEESNHSVFKAAVTSLGFSEDFIEKNRGSAFQDETVISGMAQIGSQASKQGVVDNSSEKINGFKKLGLEWTKRIQTLLNVIRSDHLNQIEKFAAYGALFYLLCPIDLIPDQIPVFGLMDDFLILGLVMAYYLSRFPDLFGRSE